MLELDDPAFLCRRAAGFAPSLLLGVFDSPRATGTRFVESPAPTVIPREPIRSFLSDNADLLRCFEEPVACHGGLLVLRRYRCSTERGAVDLCACNPMTGHRCFLPSPEVYASAAAILIGENAAGNGSPFQLLAVDQDLSRRPRRAAHGGPSAELLPAALPIASCLESSPLVINRVAYWMNTSSLACPGYNAFALDVDGGCAELIKGPRELEGPRDGPNDVLLALTPDRRLSFVVLEELVISMFVLLSERSRSWERRAVVVREGILAPPHWMRLDCFGERSGTVVICMGCQPGRLLLNLETKEVMHMSPEPKEESLEGRCHLYEMDLPLLTVALLKSPNSCAAS
uniref:DUF7595 domain-containing protein n=1 Tax=Setaria italica TaxID=4555 RepID=K3ZEY7_SETIT